MPIRSSESFRFDGRDSSEFGIANVNVGSGSLLEEPFMATRRTVIERVRGNPVSYLIDLEEDPLKFSLSFFFDDPDGYTEDDIRAVARWLLTDHFKELELSDDSERRYYGVFVGDSKLVHNGVRQGYLTIDFESISAYSYTPVYTSSVYDYSDNDVDGTEYTFDNKGDLPTKPIIEVEIVNGDSFSIENTSNGGQILEFEDLDEGEELTIDCESETIESSISDTTYRYDNMTDDSEFLEMLYGDNVLVIKGDIKIQWKWQAPLLQG